MIPTIRNLIDRLDTATKLGWWKTSMDSQPVIEVNGKIYQIDCLVDPENGTLVIRAKT